MAEMSDNELAVIVSSLEQDSVSYNSEFMKENEELLRRYNQELYGDEEEGFSKVIASDVKDTVEADMTSMVRVFLGSGDIIVFEPVTDDPEEVAEARVKSQYINYLVQKRPGAYKIIHDFLKDAEIQKMGVLHYFMETIRDTREQAVEGVTLEELTLLADQLLEASDKVASVDIVAQTERKDDDLLDARIRLTSEKKELVIDNITTEDFLISRNSRSVEEAQAVGHISFPTRSELVASGMSEAEVNEFPTNSSGVSGSNAGSQDKNNGANLSNTMKAIRWRDEGGEIVDSSAFSEWSAETVKRVLMYAKVDYDGDGIGERRRIVKIGNTITENEPYDHVPYAITSAIIEPHKAIGNGRASLVIQDQSVSTELQRALLDNIYDHGNPRSLVGNGVNIDDFLDERKSGVIRMNPESRLSPQDGIAQINTPYVGGEILQVMQSRAQDRAARTGGLLNSQGLEADQMSKETATRFSGVEKANEAKVELVARNHAETGFRKLYEGIAWTLQRFQDEEQRVRVSGSPISVVPSAWQFETVAVSQVGLGAGGGEQTVQQLSGILAIQQQLQASGSLLVDDQDVYNTLDKTVQALGFAKTSDFFNNPDVPQELLLAQYQQLVIAMGQAQQQIEQLSQTNPLAEAEMVKQQGNMAINQQKQALDVAKFDAQRTDKQIELVKDASEFESTQAFNYTKLELENNVDIPGEGQGQ